MPDVGTPQATWREAPEVREFLAGWPLSSQPSRMQGMEAAVAADRRIQAATLRAKIEALVDEQICEPHWKQENVLNRVLAVLDAVLGGDS